MKNFILKMLFLIIAILQGPICLAQTQTITYNIPGWNVSGSFTVSTGIQFNPITNREEGFIKFVQDDGTTFIVDPQKINDILKEVESNSIGSQQISNLDQAKKADIIIKLKKFKEMMEDKETMKKLSSSLRKTTSQPWIYTLHTIRNLQETVNGNID